jgi:hypothetical protein
MKHFKPVMTIRIDANTDTVSVEGGIRPLQDVEGPEAHHAEGHRRGAVPER